MTLYKSTLQFPGGVTDGTTIDGTNSALPDGFSTISVVGGTLVAGTESTTVGGNRCMVVTPVTTATASYVGWTSMTGASNAYAARFLAKTDASAPTSTQVLCYLRNGSGTSGIGYIGINATFNVVGKSDSVGATVVTSSGTLSASTWYDWDIQGANPTLTTGFLHVTVRNLAGTTVATVTIDNADFGTTAVGTMRFVAAAALAGQRPMKFKYLTAQTGSSTQIAAPWGNNPPTCTAAASAPALVSTTFTLTGTDADTDGTIVTRLWTCTSSPGTAPTITSSGSATATVTLATQGKYTFNYHVVDDAGGTADATCTAWAFPASGTDSIPTAAAIGTDGWAAIGGTPIASITDGSGSTGLQPPT